MSAVELHPVSAEQASKNPIIQGDDWVEAFSVEDTDGSAYDLSSVTEVEVDLRYEIDDDTAVWEGTKTGGEITVVGGTITISVPAATTATITGPVYFDVRLTGWPISGGSKSIIAAHYPWRRSATRT